MAANEASSSLIQSDTTSTSLLVQSSQELQNRAQLEKLHKIMRIDEYGQIFDLRADGDMIIEVGAQRMRVSSDVLASASVKFGDMFKELFEEGLGDKKTPVVLDLPMEYSVVIWIICCVLHHRNDLVRENLTPFTILTLADGIKEYELQVALKYASAELLKPRSRIFMMDTVNLLSAAILVDNKEMIKMHASDLLLEYAEPYSSLSEVQYIKDVLTPGVLEQLENQRTELRRRFYNIWKDHHRNCTCEWAKKRSEIYQQLRLKFPEEQRYLVPLSAAMKEMKVLVGSFGNKNLRCTPVKEDDGTYYHKPPVEYILLIVTKW